MAGSQGKILAKIFCLKQKSAMDDEDMFQKFWTNVEGCEVTDMGDGQENFKVPNKEEFEDQLWKLQNKFKKKKYKHLVLAISSHGKENELTSGNGKDEAASFEIRWWRGNLSTGYTMKIKDLLDIFGEFRDKNIIFLMQMCRTRSNEGTVTGLGVDSGVSMHHSATLPRLGSPNVAYPLVVHGRTSSNETLSQARENMQWPKTWKLGQPCIRNSVMMFSASSGYKSYTDYNRLEYGGGWLFVTMNEVMKTLKDNKIHEISVIDLLLKVNEEMGKKETGDGRNIGLSSFNHMLTENIYFKFKL